MPVLGIVPYLHNLLISEEDSVALDAVRPGAGLLDIAVVRLPRIANFDDFDLLAAEQGVGLRYVTEPLRLGRPDLIIIPGSKSTVNDLAFLRESGLARAIVAQARSGTPVLGICGGYQMLGETILDPERVESNQVETPGLGLLPATTTFSASKRTVRVKARVVAKSGPFASSYGNEIAAYEIHIGTTEHRAEPMFQIMDDGGSYGRDVSTLDADGCALPDGLVMGSYLHGLFENACLRRSLIEWLATRRGIPVPGMDRSR